MTDAMEKCTVCVALLDEEDLFCPNCGTEAPHRGPARPVHVRVARHNFTCAGCGASMSYDASAGSLRCPFCGSVDLSHEKETKVLAADRIVPFKMTREEAEQRLRKWLGTGFWRPGDLASAAQIEKMTPVYVPYWVFGADTHTYWTADTSETPPGARGEWYPLFGERRGRHEDILVGASAALTSAETDDISPFDLSKAVPADQVDLENVTDERFAVPRKYARPLARSALEIREADECAKFVPGRMRNMKVNVLVEGLSSEPVLLPVWIAAYRYRDKVYRFLVNGQTGRTTGHAPTSYRKIAAAVVIGAAILVIVLLLAGLLASN